MRVRACLCVFHSFAVRQADIVINFTVGRDDRREGRKSERREPSVLGETRHVRCLNVARRGLVFVVEANT